MGGRGSNSGGADGTAARANEIKREMLEAAMNSKFKGVQRDAREGTGIFSFKEAKAVGKVAASKIEVYQTYEKNGKTLIDGILNEKHVFYAGKNTDPTIIKIKNRMADEHKRKVEESKVTKPEIRTTTTYERWKKKHDKDFDAWYYGGSKKKR